jgi:glycerophosphoryl diester phosphodiesterase
VRSDGAAKAASPEREPSTGRADAFARPAGRPLVFGHRGARAHAPENTIAAFERAMADGADGVELDVRTTADDEVVVLHDVDLARVTGGRDARTAAALDVAEICAVELEGGARVPTLAETLDWAEARGALLNVELKHDVRDRGTLARLTARLIRTRPRLAGRVLLSSFDPQLLAWSAIYARELPRALLVHAGERLAWTRATRLAARALGCVAAHPQHTMCSPALVRSLRDAGLRVNTWTVNDASEASALALLGVDGIISDDPAAILRGLGLR